MIHVQFKFLLNKAAKEVEFRNKGLTIDHSSLGKSDRPIWTGTEDKHSSDKQNNKTLATGTIYAHRAK